VGLAAIPTRVGHNIKHRRVKTLRATTVAAVRLGEPGIPAEGAYTPSGEPVGLKVQAGGKKKVGGGNKIIGNENKTAMGG
jgi:hypothetical protein